MIYRYLGKSGIKVSAISYGHMIIAQETGKKDIYDDKYQKGFNEVIKACIDAGINYFDTAEAYGGGESERTLGIALKALNIPRESYVVSTKLFFNNVPLEHQRYNTYGLSRKHIIEGTRNSLKRLQLDYADIIFAHRYDPDVPLEEVCRAFDWIINQGLAFYWGTSEWTAEEIRNAHQICDKFNLIKPIVEQPQYNMLYRQKFEVEYGTLFDQYGLGSTIYSPLAGGILTGKYNNGIPPNSRLYNEDTKLWYWNIFLKPEVQQKRIEQFKELEAIAKNELGCTLTQFALAWALKNKDVSTALIGANTPQQLLENVTAVKFIDKITNQIDERVEKILDNKPQAYQNWKKFGKPEFMMNRR